MCSATDDPTTYTTGGYTVDTKERLEYLRGEIEAERISMGEIAELQSLAAHIDPTDVVLLEWAGVPEHRDIPDGLARSLYEAWGEDYDDTMRDLASHGADAGFPGITYYRDTVALYERHHDEIWEMLEDDASGMGYPHALALVATFGGATNVGSQDQLANLLVWYAAERIANAR